MLLQIPIFVEIEQLKGVNPAQLQKFLQVQIEELLHDAVSEGFKFFLDEEDEDSATDSAVEFHKELKEALKLPDEVEIKLEIIPRTRIDDLKKLLIIEQGNKTKGNTVSPN